MKLPEYFKRSPSKKREVDFSLVETAWALHGLWSAWLAVGSEDLGSEQQRSDNLPDLTLPAQGLVDYHLFVRKRRISSAPMIEGKDRKRIGWEVCVGIMVQVEKWSLRFEFKWDSTPPTYSWSLTFFVSLFLSSIREYLSATDVSVERKWR